MTLGEYLLQEFGPNTVRFNRDICTAAQYGDPEIVALPHESHCGQAIFKSYQQAWALSAHLDSSLHTALWALIENNAQTIYYG